jgi:hypothetical protein
MQEQKGQGFRTWRRALYLVMREGVLLLKVLAVMTVAGLGGGAIGAGFKPSHDGSEVGFGTFVLVGAYFLYRVLFGPSLHQR